MHLLYCHVYKKLFGTQNVSQVIIYDLLQFLSVEPQYYKMPTKTKILRSNCLTISKMEHMARNTQKQEKRDLNVLFWKQVWLNTTSCKKLFCKTSKLRSLCNVALLQVVSHKTNSKSCLKCHNKPLFLYNTSLWIQQLSCDYLETNFLQTFSNLAPPWLKIPKDASTTFNIDR